MDEMALIVFPMKFKELKLNIASTPGAPPGSWKLEEVWPPESWVLTPKDRYVRYISLITDPIP